VTDAKALTLVYETVNIKVTAYVTGVENFFKIKRKFDPCPTATIVAPADTRTIYYTKPGVEGYSKTELLEDFKV